ncbi:NAD(P)-dependent alcohol dehydrogenase [Nitratireductor sp. GCM10026969]|uniref:NAD(P)-dependent alcohol dehydrogenase n=1 Tax=Nitratireductor sp. GCM10026969 TaxID=3252645 RepID=UPI00360D0E74
MRQNRAAVLTDREEITIMDWPMPACGSDQVVIEVAACGVCGSDMHFFHHGRIGSLIVTAPLVLGHEASGTIVEAGENVDPSRLGQRVAIEPQMTCGTCASCLSGRQNLCPDVRYFSAFPVHGAFQRYVSIPSPLAHPLPETESFEAGGLMEPVSVVLWAAERARIMAGDRVLITGAGPIGNLAVQIARLNGAVEITAVDIVRSRLDYALSVGASAVCENSNNGLTDLDRDFDVLIECTGHPATVSEALLHVRPAGRAVLVGMAPTETQQMPLPAIQVREIEISGTFRFANCYLRAIRIAASGRLMLDEIVNARFTLDETSAALSSPRTNAATLKPMVYPD